MNFGSVRPWAWFVVAFLLFLLGYVAGCGGRSGGRSTPVVVHKVDVDTVIRLVPSRPIVIDRARGSVVVRRSGGARPAPVAYVDTTTTHPDTVLIAEPFVSRLDTISGGDTIVAEFSFPPPLHTLLLRRAPDSVITHTITVTQESIREPNFFEKIGYVAAGALLGGGIVFVSDRMR